MTRMTAIGIGAIMATAFTYLLVRLLLMGIPSLAYSQWLFYTTLGVFLLSWYGSSALLDTEH